MFGPKLTSTENESDDEEKKTKGETKNTKIEETEKSKDDGVTEENGEKVDTSDKNVDVVENTEEVSSVNEKKEDNLTSEESSAKDENDDTVFVNGDAKIVVENGESVAEETNDRFFVKEWCVYGDKDVKIPDKVFPKGCLLYTSPSPRDGLLSRMPSSA